MLPGKLPDLVLAVGVLIGFCDTPGNGFGACIIEDYPILADYFGQCAKGRDDGNASCLHSFGHAHSKCLVQRGLNIYPACCIQGLEFFPRRETL